MINFSEVLNNYNKEELEKIIKIYINNPYINLLNTIYLNYQGLKDNEILIKKRDNDESNVVIYIYSSNDDIKYYEFSKKELELIRKDLSFNNISYKFYKETNIKVKINNEIDYQKKDYFINNNILYISDMIEPTNQCLCILYQYIEYLTLKLNSIGTQKLLKIMIDYFFINKEIDLPKIIVNTYEISRIIMFDNAFDIFYKIINKFYKRFVKLNELLYIDLNSDYGNLNDIYSIDELNKIKNDITSDNLIDYPYYYL